MRTLAQTWLVALGTDGSTPGGTIVGINTALFHSTNTKTTVNVYSLMEAIPQFDNNVPRSSE
jgi:hypothetical protein